MNNNNQKPQAGEESAETRLLCELQRIVADLAEWSERWPRTRIHSARLQDQMDGELRALEDRAIAAAAKSHNATEPRRTLNQGGQSDV